MINYLSLDTFIRNNKIIQSEQSEVRELHTQDYTKLQITTKLNWKTRTSKSPENHLQTEKSREPHRSPDHWQRKRRYTIELKNPLRSNRDQSTIIGEDKSYMNQWEKPKSQNPTGWSGNRTFWLQNLVCLCLRLVDVRLRRGGGKLTMCVTGLPYFQWAHQFRLFEGIKIDPILSISYDT